jgi:hypothetical protein
MAAKSPSSSKVCRDTGGLLATGVTGACVATGAMAAKGTVAEDQHDDKQQDQHSQDDPKHLHPARGSGRRPAVRFSICVVPAVRVAGRVLCLLLCHVVAKVP